VKLLKPANLPGAQSILVHPFRRGFWTWSGQCTRSFHICSV